MEQKQGDFLLPASIIIAAVMISGTVYYTSKGSINANNLNKPSADQNAPTTANLDGLKIGGRDVVLGDSNAPVTFIEYGDFQCPFCARLFTQVQSQLRDEYIQSGKVKMVYRNFAFLGPESTAAAEAAECAKDQGKFWAYHDALYSEEILDNQENNGNLNKDLFMKIASRLEMDTNAFQTCIDSEKYKDEVAKETENGGKVGVDSTPTSFINGKKISGAQPYDQFKSEIEAALKK